MSSLLDSVMDYLSQITCFIVLFITSDGSQWAHLSCALWIPEIAIVDTEKMEPIDKLDEIPVGMF